MAKDNITYFRGKMINQIESFFIRRARSIYIFICLISLSAILFCGMCMQTEISNINIKSENRAIVISWDLANWNICDYVKVTIRDSCGIVYEEEIQPIVREVSYVEGIPGSLYTVSVSAHYKNDTYGDKTEKKVMFLDYNQIPDMPLMIINTVSGKDPVYDQADKPDGELWGSTMVNNEYVSGEMYMTGIGEEDVSLGIEIRVRGNTSSVKQDKKSYKIKLQTAKDLLGRKEKLACSEWVLLNNGTNLNTYIGDYVGELCGMEWQPQMIFVNVILNGDWKGCYCLTEAVGIESSHGLVGESGYIFENDAYWWNSNGLYFKTENQTYQVGYTFKYPTISDCNEDCVLSLQNYMQEVENLMLVGDTTYNEYIDTESYCRWILARDILGNDDSGGSNMYFYKYDYDANNPTATKVKMGPLWDFDKIFYSGDKWSDCRTGRVSYFPQLFGQDAFVEQYTENWSKVSTTLYNDIEELLTELEEEQGKALEESWELDSARWETDIVDFEGQKENALNWFSNRIVWMNNELQFCEER